MRHPWEGTIHQHTAIRADHRRRTARPARDCTAIASLVAPCHSGVIPVRTARDCNHHQSCDPQRATSSAEPAQAMSTEIQLSLGRDAGPNDDSTQVEEAARAREPRSRYRPDGSRRRTQKELQKRRKAKQEGTGFWATPQGRRLTAPRKMEPFQNRSQTWQDRDGVWHNWRTSETASESASARTRNAQQTWNQTGQDWRRDRPSSSQDWRHDWQWEGQGSHPQGYSSWEPADDEWGPGSDLMWYEGCWASVAQAQANQGRFLAPGSHRSAPGCGDLIGDTFPGKNQAPTTIEAKIGGEVEFV